MAKLTSDNTSVCLHLFGAEDFYRLWFPSVARCRWEKAQIYTPKSGVYYHRLKYRLQCNHIYTYRRPENEYCQRAVFPFAEDQVRAEQDSV